ncbi:MAG: iron chelate uptake ABC transporter family permease subunit [Pseudomonadota bacterium]
MPDFLLRAWFAGLGVAAVAGPLGCFVVWRRMAYFGDTLAHSALLGVTLGLLLGADLLLAVAGVSVLLAVLVVLLQQQRQIATDTLLGIFAHSALALGLVTLGLAGSIRVDLLGYLFGDILAVGWRDIAVIWLGGAVILAFLVFVWRWLLFATLHEEMARAEGAPVFLLRLALMVLIALIIAGAMKVVGILLITAMLIIPAAAARPFAGTPERMAWIAALIGMTAVTLGLALSWRLDTPAGPSIVVTALVLFLSSQLLALARSGRVTPARR